MNLIESKLTCLTSRGWASRTCYHPPAVTNSLFVCVCMRVRVRVRVRVCVCVCVHNCDGLSPTHSVVLIDNEFHSEVDRPDGQPLLKTRWPRKRRH